MRKITFVTNGPPFNGHSLNKKAIGGSESAVIFMAAELHKLGYQSEVYCNCPYTGTYDGVKYHDVSDWYTNIIHGRTSLDLLVCSRYLNMLPGRKIANNTVFWMHDVYMDVWDHYSKFADWTYLMSDFQRTMWPSEAAIQVTRNGYDAETIQHKNPTTFDKKKNNYIYASRPERGLKFLLMTIWPKVLKVNPAAKLHLCGYVKHDSVTQTVIEITKNVVNHGQLNKKDYYSLLDKCGYMLYPTEFPEISCINAIEAQALGTMVITTDAFALKETVKTDTLIPNTNIKEYVNSFVEKVYQAQDEDYFMQQTMMAKDKVSTEYQWRNIAKEWHQHFMKDDN